jgi:ankyrin repeat protein
MQVDLPDLLAELWGKISHHTVVSNQKGSATEEFVQTLVHLSEVNKLFHAYLSLEQIIKLVQLFGYQQDISKWAYNANSAGNTTGLKKLLHMGADANYYKPGHGTMLETASYKGLKNNVAILLAAGANPNGDYVLGFRSPLHVAALFVQPEVMHLLINAGAHIELRDKHRYTVPLHCAVNTGGYTASNPLECVNILLQAGAYIDAQDNEGRTPLRVAAYCGHKQAVFLLLKAGADRHRPDNKGITPAHSARDPENPYHDDSIADMIEQWPDGQ